MKPTSLPEHPAQRIAFLSVLLSPFAFGAVALNVWVPLCWLWILLAPVSLWERRGIRATTGDRPPLLGPPALIGAYLLILAQIVPLPAAALAHISPGSFSAHFIPPPGRGALAPMTVSATGTYQALLFLAGVHALGIVLFSDGAERVRHQTERVLWGMAAVGSALALEGLVQAGSPHPFWLYSMFEVPGAGPHEGGIFGPYYNRDHYSNIIAIAGSVAAGLLGNRITLAQEKRASSVLGAKDFYRHLALIAALVLMAVASAASGSRGGLAAFGVGLCIGLGPALMKKPRFAVACLVVAVLALFGTGVPSAFERMADVDFENSRLLVWSDALRLVQFFPVFGCGFGGFAVAYWPYQRVVRFEYWPHAHNEYLQWMLEGGLLGVALALYAARRVLNAAPQLISEHGLRPVLAGLGAAFTHAFVESPFRIPANAAWVGLLIFAIRSWSPFSRRSTEGSGRTSEGESPG